MIWLKKTVLSCLSLERKSYLKALKYPPAMRNEMLQSCLESENWKKIPEPFIQQALPKSTEREPKTIWIAQMPKNVRLKTTRGQS